MAVQANPVAHVALGTLQRLVNTLINTSNIATLCSLPYAADYTVRHSDGRQATSLSQNVASHGCCQRRACHMWALLKQLHHWVSIEAEQCFACCKSTAQNQSQPLPLSALSR